MLDAKIGVVVIGRNEGFRLVNCLESLNQNLPAGTPKVYVDSGSTDGSIEHAKAKGFHVVSLDSAAPFTAARARNTGLFELVAISEAVEFVQFIDGDCEMFTGWLEFALERLQNDQKLAIVCGRRKEKFPDASAFNRLADIEWNTPVGETSACGGDAMVRLSAILEVNGFNPSLICGEEPEMCIRLRRLGWKIERLNADMTLHDIAMHKPSQWWMRNVRGGWAIAEGFDLYGQEPEKYMVKEFFSGWFWGALIPLATIIMALIFPNYGPLLLLCYPLLAAKIFFHRRRSGDRMKHAWIYAFWCTTSKFPQALGQFQYLSNTFRTRQATLIEYK